MRCSRKGPLRPTSEAPEVKGHYYDSAGSSEGLSLPPKQNSRGAERLASLATPTRLPGILAGSRGARDQGSPPLDKYRRGRGSSEEFAQSFHPREAHFRGMCLPLHLHRSPRRTLGGWAQARIARHQRFVVFSAAVSLCSSLPRTAAGWHCGKIRTGSTRVHTHTRTHSFLLQSKHVLKLYQIGRYCRPGV